VAIYLVVQVWTTMYNTLYQWVAIYLVVQVWTTMYNTYYQSVAIYLVVQVYIQYIKCRGAINC
jgi:hypothetical protein